MVGVEEPMKAALAALVIAGAAWGQERPDEASMFGATVKTFRGCETVGRNSFSTSPQPARTNLTPKSISRNQLPFG